MSAVRVAIVNDYPVVIAGLTQMLQRYGDRVRVVDLVVDRPPREPVDVVLYDPFAGPQPREEVVEALLVEHASARVLLYTWSLSSELVDEALRVGFAAYVDKAASAADLVSAIERLADGERGVVVRAEVTHPLGITTALRVERPPGRWPGQEHDLSPREAEVVSLITQGLTNQDITEHSSLSINTVKSYIRSAYLKMGVTSRSQAVRWGMLHGMDRAEPEDPDHADAER